MTFPLETADPASLRLDPEAIGRLVGLIDRHVADGRYPGAQIAFARDGRLALHRSFGHARIAPRPVDTQDDTPRPLLSTTQTINPCPYCQPVDPGAQPIADQRAAQRP